MTSRPPGSALLDAVAVMDRLRSPGGCPWDAAQTHASLARYAIEEAHEVAEAAESGDAAALVDELGDLLLQVLFHARVAAEAAEGGFDIDDVARSLVAKLTARHPHVFGPQGVTAPEGDGAGTGAGGPLTPEEVETRWDALKAAHQQRASVLDGVPVTLPALARAQKVVSRARKAGLAVGAAETTAGGDADTGTDPAASLGITLLEVVRRADARGVDAESALREQVRSLEARLRAAEESAGRP